MKKIRTIFFTGIFSIFVMLSCSKDDNNDRNQCNIHTVQETASEAVSVRYIADKTAEGSITSLTYQGENGPVTVSNPTLPFSVTVNVPAGKPIGIAIQGRVTSGKIQISHAVTALDDGVFMHQSGTECGG